MSDAGEVPSEASSPLSTALDTSALEASNQAVDNPACFTESESSQYIEYGGKVYLSVDKTASLRKDSEPSWVWAYGDEVHLLTGERPQKNWRCGRCYRNKPTIISVESTTFHAGEHLRKKHRIFKPGIEPTPWRLIGQQVAGMAYQALVSTTPRVF